MSANGQYNKHAVEVTADERKIRRWPHDAPALPHGLPRHWALAGNDLLARAVQSFMTCAKTQQDVMTAGEVALLRGYIIHWLRTPSLKEALLRVGAWRPLVDSAESANTMKELSAVLIHLAHMGIDPL